jgi:hypothetical protein
MDGGDEDSDEGDIFELEIVKNLAFDMNQSPYKF